MGFKAVGDQTKVLAGVLLGMGVCSIPLFWKTKRGHDLFSQEKPQAIYDAEVKRQLDPFKKE
ncbi:unnamed protein product [Aphanomyces euteiches]